MTDLLALFSLIKVHRILANVAFRTLVGVFVGGPISLAISMAVAVNLFSCGIGGVIPSPVPESKAQEFIQLFLLTTLLGIIGAVAFAGPVALIALAVMVNMLKNLFYERPLGL